MSLKEPFILFPSLFTFYCLPIGQLPHELRRLPKRNPVLTFSGVSFSSNEVSTKRNVYTEAIVRRKTHREVNLFLILIVWCSSNIIRCRTRHKGVVQILVKADYRYKITSRFSRVNVFKENLQCVCNKLGYGNLGASVQNNFRRMHNQAPERSLFCGPLHAILKEQWGLLSWVGEMTTEPR